jgi:DNA polymerase elongation subunit (family B)
MIGKDALSESIRLSIIAQNGIKKILKKPQDLEYEKTFWPFILFTKKRYAGDKYEFDLNKCKQTSMGIVTKRRDNAPIVKVIFGGIIDRIMRDKNILSSLDFLKTTLGDLV